MKSIHQTTDTKMYISNNMDWKTADSIPIGTDSGTCGKYTYPDDSKIWGTISNSETERSVRVSEVIALIDAITSPLITNENQSLKAMHSFMNKHEWLTINEKNQMEMLKRIPINMHTVFITLMTPLITKYTVRLCKTCGTLEVEV